jgi:hypothetical protein
MKKTLIMELTFMSVLLSITFNGCSSKTYTLNKGYKDAMKKSKNIALISDSCISYDSIGENNDYLSIYKSKESTEILASLIKNKLSKNGFHINYIENRTVCASFSNPSTGIRMKIEKDDDIKKGNLPYFHASIKEIKYKEALKHILSKSFKTALKKEKSEDFFFEDKAIYKSLEIFKNRTKQDKLLVLITNGTIIHTDKTIGGGLLHIILTRGKMNLPNKDFMDSYAVLIDLVDKKVLWTSAIRLKKAIFLDFDKKWYESRYYNKVLKSLVDNLK